MGGRSSKDEGQVNNHIYVDNKIQISKEYLFGIYAISGILIAMLIFKMYQAWYRSIRKKVTRSNAVDQA